MLNYFRNFAHSFVTKFLLALLILSFAVWGVEDVIKNSAGNKTLATIGKHEITSDEYIAELRKQTENIRKQLGANYSPELLASLNIPQFVLRQMIQESLLTQEAERIGLIPDDRTVAQTISKDPSFLNPSGNFDKTRFESMLRRMGISEKKYTEKLRRRIAGEALFEALMVELPISDKIIENIIAAENQQRQITLYSLSSQSLESLDYATQLKQLKDEEIEKFYKENSAIFTTPEYRRASFVKFTIKDILAKSNLEKTNQNEKNVYIENYYRDHADEFKTAERRSVEQLLYSSKEEAEKAYNIAISGDSFAAIAKKIIPLNSNAVNIGKIERKALPEKMAEIVFSLNVSSSKQQEISKPEQSSFGWHLFKVSEITPSGIKPLSEVRKTIEDNFKQQLEDQAIADYLAQIEDALAGGEKLPEIATRLNLKIEKTESFDKTGNLANGKVDNVIPPLDRFIETAFNLGENEESAIITSKGGVYYILQVEEIVPERLQALEQIKPKVISLYKEHKNELLLNQAALKIDNEIKNGNKPSEIIKKYKLTQLGNGYVARNDKMLGDKRIPADLLTIIFNSEIDSLTNIVFANSSVNSSDHKSARLSEKLLAHVTAIKNPEYKNISDSEKSARKQQLQNQMQEEIMLQFIQSLERRYKITHDQKKFELLTQVKEE